MKEATGSSKEDTIANDPFAKQENEQENFQKLEDSEDIENIPDDTPSKISELDIGEPKVAGAEALSSLFQKHDQNMADLLANNSERDESDVEE